MQSLSRDRTSDKTFSICSTTWGGGKNPKPDVFYIRRANCLRCVCARVVFTSSACGVAKARHRQEFGFVLCPVSSTSSIQRRESDWARTGAAILAAAASAPSVGTCISQGQLKCQGYLRSTSGDSRDGDGSLAVGQCASQIDSRKGRKAATRKHHDASDGLYDSTTSLCRRIKHIRTNA